MIPSVFVCKQYFLFVTTVFQLEPQVSVKVDIGFAKEAPVLGIFGINVYHKNRLIMVRAFQFRVIHSFSFVIAIVLLCVMFVRSHSQHLQSMLQSYPICNMVIRERRIFHRVYVWI